MKRKVKAEESGREAVQFCFHNVHCESEVCCLFYLQDSNRKMKGIVQGHNREVV